MFDAIRNNKKIIQIVLALIILPFAFFGMDSLVRNAGSDNDAASVGGSKITAQEFQQALREQQERMRPVLGGRVDPALLDNTELRRSVLDGLVSQRLTGLHAVKSRLSVSDDMLVRFIASAPSLQENGKFSPHRYEMLVTAQGMSKEMFEARLRQDLAMQQALMAVSDATVTGQAAAGRWLGAQLEEREISEVVLRPEPYVDRVKVTAEAVKTFYEANRKQFETPEQLRAEYLVLDRQKLLEQAVISDAEVKSWYQANADRYRQAEERRASHILITAKKGAPEAEDKAAHAKAEEVLAQVKKSPGDFARLARQHSQDPGSAEKGGDLDWMGRGMMVKPFEKATFALKEGQVSDVVRSDFGFHIIRLTGVRPERSRPLEEVRGEIAAELRQQWAARKHAEIAEGFFNIVYEQADSLKPAAEKYKLAVQQSDWLARGGAAAEPFVNAKLMAALFSDDAIKNKRNTEAVEVAPNVLVSARVLEHRPAAMQPLETVSAAIEKMLVRQEAAKLAARDGEEKLARLIKGESVGLAWGAARTVSRAFASNLPQEVVRAIFKADAAKIPAHAGVPVPGGYALYRISQVKPHAIGGEEPPRAKSVRNQYARLIAEEEFAAWLAVLKNRYPVEINQAALETRDK
ncbi:MAG: SurA N-terminal domain-containing protein [Rhodocyclaceae bacterium]|nr:SurA N-terminal domain-containing protein [Rhodocyclaceae bacterium]